MNTMVYEYGNNYVSCYYQLIQYNGAHCVIKVNFNLTFFDKVKESTLPVILQQCFWIFMGRLSSQFVEEPLGIENTWIMFLFE